MRCGLRQVKERRTVAKALNLAKPGFDTTLHAFLGAEDQRRHARDFLTREGVG